MNYTPQLLLVGAVAAVGLLHTIVPDHWVPITLIARQHGWSGKETAQASLQAGFGHVMSTLLIAAAVWLGGVAFAARFGHIVDTATSIALIGFGAWIAISALREMRGPGGHRPAHSHRYNHFPPRLTDDPVHGWEQQSFATDEGALKLSIFSSPRAHRIYVCQVRPSMSPESKHSGRMDRDNFSGSRIGERIGSRPRRCPSLINSRSH
jgi:hypothetical protein